MRRAEPMTSLKPLAPDSLCRRTDQPLAPDTAAGQDAVVGQARALEAVRFGVAMRRDGYNVFALGPPGVGKHRAVLRVLREAAAKEPVPSDWCYVFDFTEPNRPRALPLPPGRGAQLRRDMQRLIEELRAAIPAAFEAEGYRTRRKLIEEQLKQRQEQAFAELERDAAERKAVLIRTPLGLAVAPSQEGEVLDPDAFKRLPEQEQERYREDMKRLQDAIQATLASLPVWEREQREKIRELDQEVTRFAVAHLLEEVRSNYRDLPAVLAQLEAVQQDLLEHAEELLPHGDADERLARLLRPAGRRETPALRRYEVNLLVDRSADKGAPVVYEDHPSHPNLIGRIEHQAELGTLVTDFHLIKAGALHRANGGYLVLDARRVLQQPLAWDELKRAIRSRTVRIESLGQALGLASTVTLDPEPIPLDVKVVLVGDRLVYYLLAELDPDFLELCKVSADFEDVILRDAAGERAYAQLLGAIAREEDLLPLDGSAVARATEHGARIAGDAERLSIHLESVGDLLREADHWARQAGRSSVSAAEVEQAILAQMRRADRVRERLHEEIARGTILIDTRGQAIGQVNGLSVFQIGRFAFGRPSRITARVRLGGGQLVDIEREVELGGPLHSKGVLILQGFLGGRYAAERPLSLSASLVFEQSYGGVEGDSASLAELIALLSALAEVPLKQSLALTGSVNQQGQVQAVGGVNEKIEGFFDVCREKGLTGEQGVLIPASNVKHLMLRADVVEAAAQGRFQVYPVESVDQALELLTGMPAGERDASGDFPEGSVNRKVESRLARFAEKARAFAKGVKAPLK